MSNSEEYWRRIREANLNDAEARARFRRLLEVSSLGDPEAQAAIARNRRYSQALPDRWARLSEPILRGLLDLYRDRRETWDEGHETAVTRVLAEVDFELDQDNLAEMES